MKIPPAAALQLMHRSHYATLASHSSQQPGYPYATVLPYVLDAQHRPLLLISALAEHTRNLLADGRCSLSIVENGAEDVQAGARLTLLADAVRIEPETALRARCCRYLPAAEDLLQLDFMFFRLQPLRVRYIGGVGRMGWLGQAELDTLPVLPLEQEASLLQQARVVDGIQLLGLDAYGVDYRVDEQAAHRRQEWPDGLASSADFASAVLAELARLQP
ncbi:MAG: pyridoxamine 5'-phosphate oxidase family protein [Aquitalea sp.]|nr:pyridoxamine 5'-phosphate oxidase family protein [Aquitalea sp.]